MISGEAGRKSAIAFFILLAAATVLVSNPPAFAVAAEEWDLCRQKDPERAVAACDRLIESKPEPPDLATAHLLRGAAYERQSKYQQAIADYNEALRFNPKNPLAYYLRSLSYYDEAHYEKAIVDYAAAYRLDPTIRAQPGFGMIAKGRTEAEQMIADFTEAILHDPQDVIAYLYRGAAYKEQGKYDQAIADLDEAIRLDPNNADAYFERAVTNIGRRDWDHAQANMAISRRLQRSPTP
jgi:tetratricopeptide (TPR) repeat protein